MNTAESIANTTSVSIIVVDCTQSTKHTGKLSEQGLELKSARTGSGECNDRERWRRVLPHGGDADRGAPFFSEFVLSLSVLAIERPPTHQLKALPHPLLYDG